MPTSPTSACFCRDMSGRKLWEWRGPSYPMREGWNTGTQGWGSPTLSGRNGEVLFVISLADNGSNPRRTG